MGATQLRERIAKRFLDEIADSQFPSPAMLDRLESTLTDRETLEDYAESLVEKVEATRFPSTALLSRLDQVLARLDQEEQRERAQALHNGS